MRRSRWVAAVVAVVMGGGLVAVAPSAWAHQCPDGDTTSPECRETEVYPDWRPNYVPLFDLPARDEQGSGTEGEQQRKEAQRWRECDDAEDGEQQQCAWVEGGNSARPYETDLDNPRPNELHIGYAASHCFLAELAHDCDSHKDNEFGTHDSHGGATYVDVCLSSNPDGTRCDDGMSDTQAGVTVVDHLTCPVGCADEYHVVRPLDQEYTNEQMADSAVAIERIAADPQRHVCGYEKYGSNC